MNNDKQKLRSDIPESDRWNIEAMYPDEAHLNDDISNGLARAESLAAMKDHVMDSPSSLLNALILFSESVRSVERAYIYAAGRGMLPFQRQLCRGMLCAAYRKAFSRAAQHTLHLDGIAAYHDIKYVYAVLYPEPRQRDNGNPFGRRAVSHGSFYGADRSDM